MIKIFMSSGSTTNKIPKNHLRKIYKEGKAKVVIAVWATELIKFLAALSIFHRNDLKNRMRKKCILSFIHPGAIHPFLHIILVALKGIE